MCVDQSYCVPFPSSFYACFLPSSFVMAKPLISLPSFSHFAEVSSPFLQLAMCFFSRSSKKSEEQEEETPLQEADTGFPFFPSFFSLFFFPFSFLFLELSLSPLFFFYFFDRS